MMSYKHFPLLKLAPSSKLTPGYGQYTLYVLQYM